MSFIKRAVNGMTVGQKLIIIVILLIVIPAVIIALLGFSLYAGGLRDRLAEGVTREINGASERIAERMTAAESYAKSVSYDYTLEQASRYVGNDADRYDTYYPELSRYLRAKFYLRPDCKLAAFSFCTLPDKKILTSTDTSQAQNEYLNNVHDRLLAYADKLDFKAGYVIIGGHDVYLVRNLYDHITYKRFGVLMLKLDMPYMLGEFLNNPAWNKGLLVELNRERLDTGNAYDSGFAQNAAGLIASSAYDSGNYTPIGSQSVIYGRQKPGNAELGYAVSISTATLMSDYYSALGKIIIVFVCTIAPISLLLILLYRSIMVPVKRLTESMYTMKEGKLGVQIDLKRGDEFGYMIDSFNSMSGEIKYLFDYVYKEELALKDAQIMALQSQINPHFLYNTLELVNWQARLSGNEDISKVIESLGTILDASMDRKGERTIPLMQELKHADAYVYIIQKRFGQKIGFERQIDESLLDVKVPRLILQPIIENAIMHGLEPTGGGKVTMRTRVEEHRLLIEIENDGTDIGEERLSELRCMLYQESTGDPGFTRLGLKNVHERIRLIYGKEYGVSIARRAGGGTVVTMAMPLP